MLTFKIRVRLLRQLRTPCNKWLHLKSFFLSKKRKKGQIKKRLISKPKRMLRRKKKRLKLRELKWKESLRKSRTKISKSCNGKMCLSPHLLMLHQYFLSPKHGVMRIRSLRSLQRGPQPLRSTSSELTLSSRWTKKPRLLALFCPRQILLAKKSRPKIPSTEEWLNSLMTSALKRTQTITKR